MTAPIPVSDATRLYMAPNTVVAPQPGPVDIPARDEAVKIELSEAGRTLAKQIKDLPPRVLDPAEHMRNARQALNELKTGLGIPAGTRIDIRLDNTGTFTVEADHEAAGRIEDMLNSGEAMELRNAFIGAHNGTMLQNMAAAMSEAMEKADADPAGAERYYDHARAIVNQTRNMDFFIRSQGDRLTGTLV